MVGEVTGRRSVDVKSKEATVLTLWEGERRPSWSFAKENEGGERVRQDFPSSVKKFTSKKQGKVHNYSRLKI
jgi:hypothetical protein